MKLYILLQRIVRHMLTLKKMCCIFIVRRSEIKEATSAESVLPSSNQKLDKTVFPPITVWLLLTRNTTVVFLIRDMSSNSVLTAVWMSQHWLNGRLLHVRLLHVQQSLGNILWAENSPYCICWSLSLFPLC